MTGSPARPSPSPFTRLSSPSNPAFRTALALATPHGRKRHGLALFEGFRAVEGALAGAEGSGFALATGRALSNLRGRALAGRFKERGIPLYELDEKLFSRLAQTEASQGIVLACRPRETGLAEALEAGFIVVADGVQDPGNLGALARSARAFGAGALIATRGTADWGNPKVLRASAGTLPGLPFSGGHTPAELVRALGKSGHRILVADSSGGRDYRTEKWAGKIALVVGNEAKGVSNEFDSHAATRLMIPLLGGVESLNVAAASAILLAEAARNRDAGKKA